MLSFACRDSESLRGILLFEHLSRGDLDECRGNSRCWFSEGGSGGRARYFGVGLIPVVLGFPLPIDFCAFFRLVSRFARFSTLLVGDNGVEVRRRRDLANVR